MLTGVSWSRTLYLGVQIGTVGDEFAGILIYVGNEAAAML